jgi:hypothetical protein
MFVSTTLMSSVISSIEWDKEHDQVSVKGDGHHLILNPEEAGRLLEGLQEELAYRKFTKRESEAA